VHVSTPAAGRAASARLNRLHLVGRRRLEPGPVICRFAGLFESGRRARLPPSLPRVTVPRVPVRPAVLVLAAVLALNAAPVAAGSYGWPVKPFDRQHAIRAGFGDPRLHLVGGQARGAFHFGVDVVAPDGSPVYAVAPGWVDSRRYDSVSICRADKHCFAYWHIRPVVRSGTYVQLHQLVGHVLNGWGHVHLAERLHGRYRNPLRRGALSPYRDHTAPTVAWVQLFGGNGQSADTRALAGVVGIVAWAFDTPPIAPPPPWNFAFVAPVSLGWQLRTSDGRSVAKQTTVSFAKTTPRRVYSSVYARGTYQNKPNRPGHYLYWITHGFNTAAYPNGTYLLEIDARDSRGNVGSNTIGITIANA
jgi:hypothetical protein